MLAARTSLLATRPKSSNRRELPWDRHGHVSELIGTRICSDVDIFSYHYYGSGDIPRVKKDCELARKHGKVFIAGEFGFFDKPSDYGTFMSILDTAGGAGSLAWSLRPASSRGGFKTHGEGNGIWSYRKCPKARCLAK